MFLNCVMYIAAIIDNICYMYKSYLRISDTCKIYPDHKHVSITNCILNTLYFSDNVLYRLSFRILISNFISLHFKIYAYRISIKKCINLCLCGVKLEVYLKWYVHTAVTLKIILRRNIELLTCFSPHLIINNF